MFYLVKLGIFYIYIYVLFVEKKIAQVVQVNRENRKLIFFMSNQAKKLQ